MLTKCFKNKLCSNRKFVFLKKYYYDEEMKENTENSTTFLIFVAYLSTVHLLLSFSLFTIYCVTVVKTALDTRLRCKS